MNDDFNDIDRLLSDSKSVLNDDLVDDIIGDVEIGLPMTGAIDPEWSHPVNRATMICLRGPCCHYWSMVLRMISLGDEIRKKHIISCTCHQEDTPLNNQNVYHCNRWWPQFLSFIPKSLRSLLRPILLKSWEKYLELIGYNFLWRTWGSDNPFEYDKKEFRKYSNLGGKTKIDIENGEL